VVNIHTIKPLDTEFIDQKSTSSKLLVSVEEHSKIGGLGGAIAEQLSSKSDHAPLLRLGIHDRFTEAGDYQWLLEQNGLLPKQIAESIEQTFSLLPPHAL
jgi:transketolase